MRRLSLASYPGVAADGSTDCSAALRRALADTAKFGGVLCIPPGRWRCAQPVVLDNLTAPVAIRGEGPNVSQLVGQSDLLSLAFAQENIGQPHGLDMADVGLLALGRAGTALRVSYGNPPVTNDHYRPSVVLRNVRAESSDEGSWAGGIDLTDAWNVGMSDVFVSGSPAGGDWNAMTGTGIRLGRMCINSHFSNVRCNFWATGFEAKAGDGPNTEGIFFSNCSMVAVKRGVWVAGNRGNALAPRISTLTWTGGMIECRVGGVADASAAFLLQDVWTALITGAQIISETLTEKPTYGIFAERVNGLVVSACDLNAFMVGVSTLDDCRGVNSHGNTFTNVAIQHIFGAGTTRSRSGHHVLVNNARQDFDNNGGNEMNP